MKFKDWLRKKESINEGWFGSSPQTVATSQGASNLVTQKQQQGTSGLMKDLAIRAAGMIPSIATGHLPVGGAIGSGLAIYRWVSSNRKLQQYAEIINKHKSNITTKMQRAASPTSSIPHTIQSIFDVDSRVDTLLRPEIMEQVIKEFAEALEAGERNDYANLLNCCTLSKIVWKKLEGPIETLRMSMNMTPENL